MAIPTEADRKLSEIGDLHAAIVGKLMVLRHSQNTERGRADLRQRLQDYADAVIRFANSLP